MEQYFCNIFAERQKIPTDSGCWTLGSKLICNPLLSSVCKWIINACFCSVLVTSSLYSTNILEHCPADLQFHSASLGAGFHVPGGLNK